MIPPGDEFHGLLQQVVAGDEAAARKLVDDYGPRLLELIRRRLAKPARARFDSADVAQDVWASFFALPAERRDFATAEELLRFLAELARNKTTDANRDAMRVKKQDVRREESLDDSQRFDKGGLVSPERTPSQILMSTEKWTEFLRTLPPIYRKVVILVRDGKSYEQIAQELNIHAKTVQRIVRLVNSKAA